MTGAGGGVATDALREREGERTLLIATRGFRDVLVIETPGGGRSGTPPPDPSSRRRER
ncbi:hypothetical protein [Streptomyces sp. YS415]|uniref:hypothetical protein n=1 Tax=Streptomyces sp. YS415 TaxID=2944806 RepID=UPI0020218165|nr:hypothetical protein [Streptomyces sp. YS415]MCL7427986.1 hypothetical protein [Streptomyces sp. YS415]